MGNIRNKVRVGLIGLGYWGPKLERNFANLPEVDFVMAVDKSLDRLAESTKIFPSIKTSQNSDDLMDGSVDAVVIATPVRTHYKLAKRALLAEKHVMVEKPITMNSTQASELLSIAKEKNLKLMVGHTFEYNPAVEAVHKIIQSGELGDIYYINSTRVNLGLLQADINVMWDLAPHDLSILCFLLEENPEKVSAIGSNYVNRQSKLNEVVYLTLKFKSGVLANLRVSWLDPVKQRSTTVVGSKKMLVYDDISDCKVVIFDKGVEVPPYSVTPEEFRASYRHGEGIPYPIAWEEPLKVECSHFINCILYNQEPRSNGDDGLRVVKILETAQRSIENDGVELRIEY